MNPERNFSETFEIGNDFTPSGLKAIITQGIKQGKISPLDLNEAMQKEPFLGYQFNIELIIEDKRRLITFEYQEKEFPEKSDIYRDFYVSIPVGTLDMTSEEVDNFKFDI
ncbi:MAG: hypothetical protein KAT77_04650 [Nanoarchaeota archaeon]|nr:hypothetical protein [Nanoarchaeota archaeon]